MIAYLRGTLVEKRLAPAPACAVLDVGGVGYETFVPLSTFDALPRVGADFRLLVHDYVREDQHALFGFATEDERDLFRMLQDVSGIGPKTALAALSGMTVRQLKAALAEGDAKALARLPGIGKRTAERICVELKGKIDPLAAAASRAGDADEASLPQVLRDAAAALVQLGRSEEDAARIVRDLARRDDLPDDAAAIVRLALSGR
jgi:Holliday junction DNA helicase RuvA